MMENDGKCQVTSIIHKSTPLPYWITHSGEQDIKQKVTLIQDARGVSMDNKKNLGVEYLCTNMITSLSWADCIVRALTIFTITQTDIL